MKSYFLLLLLSYASVASFAQWNGTPNMYNLNTGNIAIGPGTSVTPLSKLHIFDGIWGEQLRFTRNGGTIRFVQGNGLDNLYLHNGDGSKLYMFWKENGNVGIGTENPTAKLHISDGNGGDQLRFTRNGGSIKFAQGDGLDNLYLYSGDGSKMYMFWKENGNIGIGTETPSAKLHVHNDATLEQDLGSIQLLNRTSGRGNNYFMESQWLVRDDASSIGWTTARMHNGISIDGSFLTPGTDTRTWWERDPYNNIQSWGQGNQTYMTINNGSVGIGTLTTGTCKLAVEGKIGAREINVLTGPGWPDYVFEKNYNLPTLAEVEKYINQNKHLPEVPTAKEMEKNGVNLGEMNMLLLKKVEELTLYMIEQEKRIKELESKNK